MKRLIIGLALGNLLSVNHAYTCTRATYVGPDNTVITARTMDWARDVHTNIWLFPRGIKRDGAAGPRSISWTSKYGSVAASFYDVAVADGMNEKGLVANLLYLAESEYPKPEKNDKRLPLGIALWAQYVLDNFSSVEEAVKELKKEPFYTVGVMTPDNEAGTVHLAISDPSGDSAILEYLKGKLVIHHGKQYQIMTNSPSYDQQLALDAYWQQIGGATMLPGTARAADRFARASYYIKTAPQTADNQEAIAAVFSVIRNVSAPIGVATPGKPNIAQTLWRTLSDQKNKRYYFESSRSPNIFWIDLSDLNFAAGQSIKKLDLSNNIYSKNASDKFKNSEPIKFLVSPSA